MYSVPESGCPFLGLSCGSVDDYGSRRADARSFFLSTLSLEIVGFTENNEVAI